MKQGRARWGWNEAGEGRTGEMGEGVGGSGLGDGQVHPLHSAKAGLRP